VRFHKSLAFRALRVENPPTMGAGQRRFSVFGVALVHVVSSFGHVLRTDSSRWEVMKPGPEHTAQCVHTSTCFRESHCREWLFAVALPRRQQDEEIIHSDNSVLVDVAIGGR